MITAGGTVMTARRPYELPRRSRPQQAGVRGPGWPARYEIRIAGVLGSQRAAWFRNLHVEEDGKQTVISGQLADQAALHGLLAMVSDLGLGLIAVRRVDQGGTRNSAPSANR
jgi:hypothetical protein